MTAEHKLRGAVKWAYAMNWGEKGFSALFAFVLASILGPRDFGTVAMAMVYIAFIQMFLDQGLLTALIQRKDLQREHLDAVFWLDMVASLLLMTVTIGLSKWWAAINHSPELSWVVSVLSVMVPIEGLSIVQRAVLQRNLDFKSLSLRSNISVLAGGLVGLGMAFTNCGVWALVGQRVSQDFSALVLLWHLSHWRPGWRFSLKHLKELLSFSTASFGAKLAVFGNLQSDAFLMGMFFGPVAVGLYRLADRLMNLVLDGATNSLQVVSLSQFSLLQHKPLELRRSALSFLRMSSLLVLPTLAGLACVSTPLMATIGESWRPAASVLKVLCVLGMALSFSNFTGPLITATSRPHFMAILEWIRTLVSIGVLVVGAIFLKSSPIAQQVMGIALIRFALGGLIFAPIFLSILMRACGISLRDLVAVIIAPACAAAATAAVVISCSMSELLSGFKPAVLLASEMTVGGLAGAGVLLALDRQMRTILSAWVDKLLRRKGTTLMDQMPHEHAVELTELDENATLLVPPHRPRGRDHSEGHSVG